MQEECGGSLEVSGGASGASSTSSASTTTPVISPTVATGGSSIRSSMAEESFSQQTSPPKLSQADDSITSGCGVNGDSIVTGGVSRVGPGDTGGVDQQSVVAGNVADLNLAPSVASLWSQDDSNQILSSIPAMNGSVPFGGSVGPQLFGNTGLGRLNASQRSMHQAQQSGQKGILTGPTTAVGPASGPPGSSSFIGTKVSSSWSSGLGQASAWSTGAQGLAGPGGGQVGGPSGPGGPVGAVAWGRGRGSNMSPNLGGANIRGVSSGQPCPSIGVGKMSPANLAANVKFRRSTSFPGKTGIPQHGPFPPHAQMQHSHLQGGHIPPSFEITGTDDPTKDYLHFQVINVRFTEEQTVICNLAFKIARLKAG